MNLQDSDTIDQYNQLLLDIGITLLACGAHCGRIDRNVNRFAEALGCKVEILFSFGGLLMNTSLEQNHLQHSTHYKRVKSHLVHFMIISEISLLSWKAKLEKYSYREIRDEFDRVRQISPYHRIKVLTGVGFASAALSTIAKGDWRDAIVAFSGSVTGMYIRQTFVAKKYNGMVAVAMAAFVTTLFSGLNSKFHFGANPEAALATSVLYLVPGIHLVNTIIDLIEGHFSTAIARGFFSAFILLCIALGMSMGILIIGIENF